MMHLRAGAVMSLLLLFACKEPVETPEAEDTSVDSGPPPSAAFDEFCGDTAWDSTLTPVTLPDTNAIYTGYNAGHTDFKKGTVEVSKVIPAHPFHVKKVKIEFADGTGTARIRLMETLGRSYPGGYPDLDTEGVNVMPPVEVEDPVAREWTEIDVSDLGIFLLPTQHYAIVNEYAEKGAPTVSIERLTDDESSRALLILPDEDTPYGIDGNFRMELVGEEFCTWEEADRWFADTSTAFSSVASAYATVADIDGDAHQDVITYAPGPQAWLGDGTGAFTELGDPFPDADYANWLLFGDVDNDGDPDAFAAAYISADADGDGWTLAEGDCNDADANVSPGEVETTDGYDDDCDLVADDGLDETDDDGDGVTILAGDCDDTRDDVAPAADELRDSRDNDCDGRVDEDFSSRMLLNDGTGHFTPLSAGVEVTEPSTAGGFGDADGDGNLDLFFGNWLEHYPDDTAVQARFYTGNGDGTFVDARDAAGLTLETPYSVYGVEWNDFDNDGDSDIYQANYHLYDNQLWQNQGDGTFRDVAAEKNVAHDDIPTEQAKYPGGHSYGGDFGDIDNDGDMDFFLANLSHPRTQPWADPSMLNINQGAPDYTFENHRADYGIVYDEGDINAQWADFDNDMDLDLAIAALYPTHYAKLYRNDGGTFTDVTYQAALSVEQAVSVVWVDVDEDGDEDLLAGGGGVDTRVRLYMNRIGQANHWVDFDLEGTSTNRDAVGARVTLTAGGVSQLREVWDGNGCNNTQKPRQLHFGLAGNTTIDSVTVHWVGGDTETFTGVSADGRWKLVQGEGVARAP